MTLGNFNILKVDRKEFVGKYGSSGRIARLDNFTISGGTALIGSLMFRLFGSGQKIIQEGLVLVDIDARVDFDSFAGRVGESFGSIGNFTEKFNDFGKKTERVGTIGRISPRGSSTNIIVGNGLSIRDELVNGGLVGGGDGA